MANIIVASGVFTGEGYFWDYSLLQDKKKTIVILFHMFRFFFFKYILVITNDKPYEIYQV